MHEPEPKPVIAIVIRHKDEDNTICQGGKIRLGATTVCELHGRLASLAAIHRQPT